MDYWKCSKCHGTGKVILVPGRVSRCYRCDGTGNAMVDGPAKAHEREIQRIENEAKAGNPNV